MAPFARVMTLVAVGALLQACNCGPAATSTIAATWKYRYNCGSATQCFDADVCSSETIVTDSSGATKFKNGEGTLTGTLTGNVFRWKARWGTPPYDEVGVWTFSSDFSSFTQTSCYTYDGTADEATTTCTGQNRGECTGMGSKTSPGAPAAVGACAAGSATKTCS